MENKKTVESSGAPHEPLEAANGGSRTREGIAKPLTAKDAGWRSPTLLVLPMTMVPIDPPQPSNRKGRR